MKNITEILAGLGIEIPADKKSAFDKEFLENYKTIAEVNGLNSKLSAAEDAKKLADEASAKKDNDLKELQKKLETAGTDSEALKKVQDDLKALQATRESEKADYEKKLASQHYEHLIREKAGELHFTSNSAKKAFIADALKQELKVNGDELLGFNDFVTSYKKEDSGAFVSDKEKKADKPEFSGKSNPESDVKKAPPAPALF